MLEQYEKYLFELNKKLDIYFSEQKDFIKCKKGCSLCCKFCYYPYSKLEYEYLKLGIASLDKKQQEIINQKALKIYKDRKEFLKTNPNIMDFYYDCPILIDDTCGLYNFRGLLCRTFGLAYKDVENSQKINVPHCVTLGLNYSNICDETTTKISEEKMKNLNLENKFKGYDLSYSSLMRDAGSEIEFGDVRMIYEWIIMDIPNYQEILQEIK